MRPDTFTAEKVFRYITLFTLLFLICWGLASVVFAIKPFWVDEWRVIYNLKFKTPGQLWGGLDYMQQFPRVYLQIVKWFTAKCDYSYTSLRLPSFIVGSITIVAAYRLMNRLYPKAQLSRFLFVMVFISSYTFTEYFVQVKQYSMEMLLSIVVLWQLVYLFELSRKFKLGSWTLLCLSFLVVPFFSYTYPIVVVPVFVIAGLQGLIFLKNSDAGKARLLLIQWLPLLCCAISSLVFYKIDVANVFADGNMHAFWAHIILDHGFDTGVFFNGFYNLFAQIGAGLIFWLLFGILGMVAFVVGVYKYAPFIFKRLENIGMLVKMYSILLLLVVLAMFLAGKLPVAEPRLNVFTVPSIIILLIALLEDIQAFPKGRVAGLVLTAILFLGTCGNIYTTFADSISGEKYGRKMAIYNNSEKAIALAQQRNIPICITPGITYPYEKTNNYPFHETMPGDWPLKTLPAYKVSIRLPVFRIADTSAKMDTVQGLPASAKEVMVGDGINYRIVNR